MSTDVPKRKCLQRKEEVHHAKEEGVEFLNLNNPVKIFGDENGRVCAMECIKMELGEPDESGRRSPAPVEGSNYNLEVDTVIMSIGTSPNPLIRTTTNGLEANKRGCLVVNEDMLLLLKKAFTPAVMLLLVSLQLLFWQWVPEKLLQNPLTNILNLNNGGNKCRKFLVRFS